MTGANFSSWYNQSEGSLYADMARFGTSAAFPALVANDGTDGNAIRVFVWGGSNTPGSQVVVGGVEQQSAATAAVGAGVFAKSILGYKANDFGFSSNGSAASLDTSGVLPLVTQLLIGQRVAGPTYLNGYVRKLSFYPKRLTNAQLQAITG